MTGTWTVMALAMNSICNAHRGEFTTAWQAAKSSAQIASETRRPFDVGIANWTLGAVGLWSGRLDGVVQALSHGHDVCRSASVGILMPNLAPTLAYALDLAGRVDEARDVMESWPEPEEGASTFWFDAWGAGYSGLAPLLLGDTQRAVCAMQRWEGLVRKHRLSGIESAVVHALAVCRAAKGEEAYVDLLDDLARALGCAESLGAAPDAARCRLAMGQLALEQGHTADGTQWTTQARSQFRGLSMPYWEDSAARLLS